MWWSLRFIQSVARITPLCLRCLVRAVRSELSRAGGACNCTYWEFLCQFANGNSKVHDTMEKCFHQATSFSEMELPGWKFLVNKENILDRSFWAYLPILGWDMSPSILLVPTPLLDHHSGCNSGVSAIPLARTGSALFSVVISQLVWLLRQINWRVTASALEVKFPEIHRLSRKEFDF